MSTPMFLVIASIVGIMVLPKALSHPARILAFYAGTLPVGSVVKIGVPLPKPFNTLSSMLGALVIMVALAHIVVYRRAKPPRLPDALWMLFLAWSGITAAWALQPRESFQSILVATPLILLVVVISVLPMGEKDVDVLRVALIASGIAVGLYAAFLLIKGSALPSHGVSERLSLSTNPQDTNPNILAASLLLPFAVSVELVLVGGHRWWSFRSWRLLGMAGAICSFVAIVFTGSRGGILSSVLALVACLLSAFRRLPESRPFVSHVMAAILVTGLVISGGIVVALAVSPEGAGRQILSFDPIRRLTETDNEGSGRLEIWTAGAKACQLHCGWGAGLGNFPAAYDQTSSFLGLAKNVGESRPAHDIYLSVAVETGIIGLTILILALLAEWREATRLGRSRAMPSLTSAIVGILVANVFLSAIWFKYFWLVFAFNRAAGSAAIVHPDRSRASLSEAAENPLAT